MSTVVVFKTNSSVAETTELLSTWTQDRLTTVMVSLPASQRVTSTASLSEPTPFALYSQPISLPQAMVPPQHTEPLPAIPPANPILPTPDVPAPVTTYIQTTSLPQALTPPEQTTPVSSINTPPAPFLPVPHSEPHETYKSTTTVTPPPPLDAIPASSGSAAPPRLNLLPVLVGALAVNLWRTSTC